MLRNLESQFAGAAEVDLSEIMSHLMAEGGIPKIMWSMFLKQFIVHDVPRSHIQNSRMRVKV